jgi:uncharacterized protein YndB with AHSA1/START domain
MKSFVNEEIELEQILPFSPNLVFHALTAEAGHWWNHRFREGSTVGFEPRIGGRFYEDFGGGSAALYAVVEAIDPPARLVLRGAMGMDGAVVSVMVFDITEEGGGARLSLRHSIIGNLEEGTVDEYREGWREIFGKVLPGWLASKHVSAA